MSEAIPARVLQRAEGRYYGKYRGIVVDNGDPQSRGRVRLRVPAVLGNETTGWALPCVPFGGSPDSGLFAVPEVEATVWVEFEAGDPSYPIWVGAFWTDTPDRSGDGDLGDWRTRTLRTVGGQVVRLDDEDGATSVTIRHHSGASVVIDDDGTIVLSDAGGEVVTLDAQGPGIRLEDASGNVVRTSSSGTTIDNGTGASIELSGPSITLKATTIAIDGQVVQVGGGGEPVLKGSTFLQGYLAHTHPTGVGPSGPPVPTTEPTSLSVKVQTG
jgi:uncharacterized protein involved in type VI secretion and phage assembly